MRGTQKIPTKTQEGLTVEEGRTKLHSSHNGERLTFLHPPFGPNNYAVVGQKIEQAGLRRPPMAETASLVYNAFNSDDKYSQEIKDIMERGCLWAFTGILYVPGEGAYIQNDPRIREGAPFMDKSELVKILESEDPSVKFVPFGYKTGMMTPEELARHELVIKMAEEEGAEKLAEVAGKHRDNPFLFGGENITQPTTRISALYSYNGEGGHRLCVVGDVHGFTKNGYAFGIQKETGKSSNVEK